MDVGLMYIWIREIEPVRQRFTPSMSRKREGGFVGRVRMVSTRAPIAVGVFMRVYDTSSSLK